MFQPGSGRNERAKELRYTIEPFDEGLFRLKSPTTTHQSMSRTSGAKDSCEAATTIQSSATEPNNAHPTQPFFFRRTTSDIGLRQQHEHKKEGYNVPRDWFWS
jgi:hypothetical protein